MSASPAPVDLPPTVAEWRAAIEHLPADASPCPHLPPARWTAIRENALDFIDRFGVEAHRLGWTASQLFGVHPKHGTLQAEWCGALMVHGERAHGVEFARVVFERTSGYRGKQGQRDGVPVWEFAKKGG
ncbi:hypothetical protein ACRAWG_05855 [Methylobacterium sp. P31]